MLRLIVACVMIATASPASAEPQPAKSRLDPERIICRTEAKIGSRVQTDKVCMSARKWADYSHDQRQSIEKVQRFEYKGG